jgi:hypothetical protein
MGGGVMGQGGGGMMGGFGDGYGHASAATMHMLYAPHMGLSPLPGAPPSAAARGARG